MKILRTVAELRAWRSSQATLGMVPTMGALHNGHLDLIKKALTNNRSTLISIFVNPSQFAPNEDLDKYPRTFDSDIEKFEATASDLGIQAKSLAVFAPTVSEMYPSGIDLRVSHQKGTFVEVLGCSHQIEGQVRPQFFRGVATVVAKLLNAAQPTKAYFGQKDIQQSVVVKTMVKDLLMPTEIVVCPTTRESNGLAMSSRNVYLTADERHRMAVIYKALTAAAIKGNSKQEVFNKVREVLNSERDLIEKIEYVALNSTENFDDLETVVDDSVISTAVRLKSGVRLIDNVCI